MAFIAGYLWNGSEDEGGTGQRLGRRWARVSAGHVSARRHQPGLNMLMTPSLEHTVLAFPPHLLFLPIPPRRGTLISHRRLFSNLPTN